MRRTILVAAALAGLAGGPAAADVILNEDVKELRAAAQALFVKAYKKYGSLIRTRELLTACKEDDLARRIGRRIKTSDFVFREAEVQARTAPFRHDGGTIIAAEMATQMMNGYRTGLAEGAESLAAVARANLCEATKRSANRILSKRR